MILKNDKTGYRFLRQKIIKSFILDFYYSKLKLGIEIDGGYHKNTEEYDTIRNSLINKYGIKIIRYNNKDIDKDLQGVAWSIQEEINKRVKELNK